MAGLFYVAVKMAAHFTLLILRLFSYLSSQVVVDTDLETPYDILLFKIDVAAGSWGMYNFYKMQVSWFLFYCILDIISDAYTLNATVSFPLLRNFTLFLIYF